jgi:hypothetical protein
MFIGMRASLAVVMLSFAASPCGAQNWLARADALFRAGRIVEAEPLYYYASRIEPRNATARAALGRFLAARGKLRIGAVLLEEARLFGGDRRVIAENLAPLYARLGDYRALSSLPNSPLSYAERTRAEWLSENPPDTIQASADSVVIELIPTAGSALGVIRLGIGRDTLTATIDPTVLGLVLDTSWVRQTGIKVFRSASEPNVRNVVGVVLTAMLGGPRGAARTNVPARFEPLSGGRGTARMGLDVLEDLAPTWSPGDRRLVLRLGGRAPTPSLTAERIPILISPTGAISMVRQGVFPLASAAATTLLKARWTLDMRNGEIVLER